MKPYLGPKAKPLPPEIAGRYAAAQAKGGEYRTRGEMAKAEECFLQAWKLLPEPKFGWSESLSKITGMAGFFLNTSQHQKALDWVPNLIQVNPTGYFTYVDILIGRIYFEAGLKADAIKWFQKAFDSGGRDAFREDNRRFLELVQPPKAKKAAVKKKVSPNAREWPEVPDPEAFQLMAGPFNLDEEVQKRVKALCAEGDELAEAGQYDEAVAKYREALFLLPRPIEKWEASTWVYTAIGDALFLKGDYMLAARPLRDVMYCPGAELNAFIRMRRGQVAFEKGNLLVAEKELAEAYRLEGEKIFADDHQKYLEFIKARLPR